MKLPLIMTAAVGIAVCSCTTDSTQYNGYLLNSTSDSIYVHMNGGKNLLYDEIGVGKGDTAKVFFKNSEGDTEIYDCAEMLDSLWYKSGTTTMKVKIEDSNIVHSSELSSDGTRVHACYLEIKK